MVAGCLNSEEKAEVETLTNEALDLGENIKDAQERMKAGTLSTEEGILLIAGWTSEVIQIYSRIDTLHEEGASFWEMLGYGALIFFGRGPVSKGPLLPVFNFIGNLFGTKKK